MTARLISHCYLSVRSTPNYRLSVVSQSQFSATTRVWLPTAARISLLGTTSRPTMGPNEHPFQQVQGFITPGAKRSHREAGNSPPSSAEIKDTFEYRSTLLYVSTDCVLLTLLGLTACYWRFWDWLRATDTSGTDCVLLTFLGRTACYWRFWGGLRSIDASGANCVLLPLLRRTGCY